MRSHRAGLFNDLIVPFPAGLMKTSVSPALVNASQNARHIENILPNKNKAGSGTKRYGFGVKGDEVVGVNTLAIWEYRKTDGTLQILAYFDDGTIQVLNEGTGAWTSLKSGLSTDCTPRAINFAGKLVICNGVDSLKSYDGSTVSDVKEFVEDSLASAKSQTDTDTISVTVGTGRDDYQVGQRIRVTFATTGAVTATISAVSGTTTKTIDVSGTPFPNPSESITSVEYEMDAPAFSYLYAEHDMLWGLSEGTQSPSTYRGADSLKVFYTDSPNNEAAWYNQTGVSPTQELNYVSVRDKARVGDELVAITSQDGLMVFIGRLQTYIYAGDDPSTAGEFVWQKTIPLGAVNGSLVAPFPNDTLFFTRFGARSLKNVFQTEQLEVVPDIGSNIDPTITEMVSTMTVSAALYKAARSCFYERDGFYIFKLTADYVLAYVLSENSKGWCLLSGLFKDATAYCSLSDGRLLIGVGGQLYAYANGTDSDAGTSYSDAGTAVLIKWWTPWLWTKSQRWANRGFQLILEETTPVTLNLYRAQDFDDNNQVLSDATVTLSDGSAFWDDADWDVDYWDGLNSTVRVRDKFLCESFWFMLTNESTSGPISLLGMRVIGG